MKTNETDNTPTTDVAALDRLIQALETGGAGAALRMNGAIPLNRGRLGALVEDVQALLLHAHEVRRGLAR